MLPAVRHFVSHLLWVFAIIWGTRIVLQFPAVFYEKAVPGAPGYGREQKLAVTAEAHHYPADCVRCDRELKPDAATAYTAFETVDVEWADLKKPGISLTNTKHLL